MMNKKEIFKKVGGIIAELNEQYEYLSESPDNLNELELELFSANANFLSDHISILTKINNTLKKPAGHSAETEHPDKDHQTSVNIAKPQTEKVNAVEKEVNAAKDAGEPATETEVQPQQESSINFEFPKAEDHNETPAADQESIIRPEKETRPSVEPEITAGAKAAAADPEETTFDEATHPGSEAITKEVVISERTVAIPQENGTKSVTVPTVNELLSRSMASDTAGVRYNNTRQSKDLKSMISLNDKLLFVRDLFNGYSLAYSEAIELLNRFDSMEAAETFLKQNYAAKNNWVDKADVANKFYDILSLRFSK